MSGDSAVLDLLRSVAESNLWQIDLATDAWDAIDRMQSNLASDLLLVDLSNGTPEGLRAVRLLRRVRPAFPVVLIGHVQDGGIENRNEPMRAGIGDCVTIPLERHQLEQVLRGVLRGREGQIAIGTRNEDVGSVVNDDLQSTVASRSGAVNGAALLRQSGADICGYKSLRAFLQSVKEEAERKAITLALEKTGWNRKAAARLLKTSYRSVLYKIEQYKMISPGPAAPSGPKSSNAGASNESARQQ